MCLILVAHQRHPRYPLIVLANRDEYYARPTAACGPWPACPELFAGRDLAAGGTWFGVRRDGRWAAVTNVREPGRQASSRFSRGWLVRDFLLGTLPAEDYLQTLPAAVDCPGFNLLLGDGLSQLWYAGNRPPQQVQLAPGVYGLSNDRLDTPWPKVVKGKAALAELLRQDEFNMAKAFDVLADTQVAADDDLPQTGVSLEWERALSAVHIETPTYGTRSATLFVVTAEGRACLVERRFVAGLTDGRDVWQEFHRFPDPA